VTSKFRTIWVEMTDTKTKIKQKGVSSK